MRSAPRSPNHPARYLSDLDRRSESSGFEEDTQNGTGGLKIPFTAIVTRPAVRASPMYKYAPDIVDVHERSVRVSPIILIASNVSLFETSTPSKSDKSTQTANFCRCFMRDVMCCESARHPPSRFLAERICFLGVITVIAGDEKDKIWRNSVSACTDADACR